MEISVFGDVKVCNLVDIYELLEETVPSILRVFYHDLHGLPP
jgi:hypothetical protein